MKIGSDLGRITEGFRLVDESLRDAIIFNAQGVNDNSVRVKLEKKLGEYESIIRVNGIFDDDGSLNDAYLKQLIVKEVLEKEYIDYEIFIKDLKEINYEQVKEDKVWNAYAVIRDYVCNGDKRNSKRL